MMRIIGAFVLLTLVVACSAPSSREASQVANNKGNVTLLNDFQVNVTGLINDGIVSGTLYSEEEADEFVFEASAGESIHLRMVETGGDNFNPKMWLYNPDGTLNITATGNDVAELDCNDSNSSNCRVLPQTGMYRLVVEDDNPFAGSGSYNRLLAVSSG